MKNAPVILIALLLVVGCTLPAMATTIGANMVALMSDAFFVQSAEAGPDTLPSFEDLYTSPFFTPFIGVGPGRDCDPTTGAAVCFCEHPGTCGKACSCEFRDCTASPSVCWATLQSCLASCA